MTDAKLTAARALALLVARGPMTAAELVEGLGVSMQAARAALRDLCAGGKAARVGDSRARPRDGVRYMAHAGHTAATAGSGHVEQFRGTDWTTATLRPGCLDHERVPSRRGDERVPHQTPQFFVTSSVVQVRTGDR